jgi:hypothetical protein
MLKRQPAQSSVGVASFFGIILGNRLKSIPQRRAELPFALATRRVGSTSHHPSSVLRREESKSPFRGSENVPNPTVNRVTPEHHHPV